MKRKEILILIGEVLGSRAVYSIASLVITITMLSGITIILRNDIRDIKNYVQSVVDKDPNYKEVHGQVSGSENVIRGSIDIEGFVESEKNNLQETTTVSNISSGYDNYTPTQTVTDDFSNRPSNSVNNSTGVGTNVANNGDNSNNSNKDTGGGNSSNNNSDETKKEEILDRSSFNGKDIMISEGEPFNPMNGLQLAATDINGKNITNKIVIKENNVDTYKPGLYTVKATVELSDKSNLEKEFFVRVEPTVLNLAVNDMRASKDILEKSEEFKLSFAVKSSKSYLEVSSVNINNKDYSVKKTFSNSFLRKSNKYEVDLVAPSKSGTEEIKIKSVTMSDGTVVDVNKSVNIEILKEEACLSDVTIKDKSSIDYGVGVSFNLNDVDNTVREAKLCVYNENYELVAEEEVLKDSSSFVTKFSTTINLKEAGNYTIKVIAKKYIEESKIENYILKEIELFSQSITINTKPVIDIGDEELENLSVVSDSDNVEVETYSENNILRSSNNLSGEESESYNVVISGYIANDKGEFPPGTLQLTVPTTAAFRVDNKGDFKSAPIIVKNDGFDKVDIYAYKFRDEDGQRGINIKEASAFNNDLSVISRSDMALSIYGSGDIAYFKSENIGSGKSGVYKDGNLINPADTEDGIRISTVNPGSSDKLTLNGIAGSQGSGINTPIKNEFTLILKIKKSQKN